MAIINTTQQINDTLNALIEDVDFSVSVFSKKMSSDEVNKVFSRFNEIINHLYEKARYLQDLREYTEKYIESEYSDKYKKLKSVTEAIEKIESQYQNNKQITHEIIFDKEENDTDIFYDFDGEPINKAFISDNNIITSGFDKIYICELVQSNDASYVSDKNGEYICSVDFATTQNKYINYIEASSPNCNITSINTGEPGKESTSMNLDSTPFIDAQNANNVNVKLSVASGIDTNKTTSEIKNSAFI